jgi:hypothetical protein
VFLPTAGWAGALLFRRSLFAIPNLGHCGRARQTRLRRAKPVRRQPRLLSRAWESHPLFLFSKAKDGAGREARTSL